MLQLQSQPASPPRPLTALALSASVMFAAEATRNGTAYQSDEMTFHPPVLPSALSPPQPPESGLARFAGDDPSRPRADKASARRPSSALTPVAPFVPQNGPDACRQEQQLAYQPYAIPEKRIRLTPPLPAQARLDTVDPSLLGPPTFRDYGPETPRDVASDSLSPVALASGLPGQDTRVRWSIMTRHRPVSMWADQCLSDIASLRCLLCPALEAYDPREVATCLRSTWPPVELFVIECGSFTESQIADALCTFREWKKETGKELTRRARVLRIPAGMLESGRSDVLNLLRYELERSARDKVLNVDGAESPSSSTSRRSSVSDHTGERQPDLLVAASQSYAAMTVKAPAPSHPRPHQQAARTNRKG